MIKVKCKTCNKVAHPSRNAALSFGPATRAYQCPANGTWHLTSSARWGAVSIKKSRKNETWRFMDGRGRAFGPYPTFDIAVSRATLYAKEFGGELR